MLQQYEMYFRDAQVVTSSRGSRVTGSSAIVFGPLLGVWWVSLRSPGALYFSAVANVDPHAAHAQLHPAQKWKFQIKSKFLKHRRIISELNF